MQQEQKPKKKRPRKQHGKRNKKKVQIHAENDCPVPSPENIPGV